MANRPIITQEDPILSKVCHAVTKFDRKLAILLDDLKETLSIANGLGLAAPQLGILRRVAIVVDDNGEMLELVNPQIIDQQGEQDGLEGCLSVPGLWGYVKRPEWVKLKAQTRTGDWFEVEGREMTARCFCHELSHLEGQLYTKLTEKLYNNEELDQLIQEQEDAQGAHK